MAVPWSTHWHQLATFGQYYWRAQNRYDVHSPFLAQWVEAVLEDRRQFYAFDETEIIRHYWKHYSSEVIDYSQDHGAGSRAGQGAKRRVKDIVRTSAVSAETGRRLFRMVLFHQPETIIELGTNLGISALYLQAACRSAKLYTIEGHPEVARLAKTSFQRAKCPTPIIRTGTFAQELPKILQEVAQVDFAWLDGDHRYEPTLRYFELMLPKLHSDSVVVVGDIHWSEEMERAWSELQQHPKVRLSVDLFDMGVLFFRSEQQQPEHFTLVPFHYKPWRLGFFLRNERSCFNARNHSFPKAI